MKQKTKLTTVFTVFFMAISLAILAPTMDALDTEKSLANKKARLQEEKTERIASEEKGY